MKKSLLFISLFFSLLTAWSQQLIDQDRTSNFIKADNGSTYYIYEDANGDFGIKSINTPTGTVNTLITGFVSTNLDKLIQLSSTKLLLENRLVGGSGNQRNIATFDLGTNTFSTSNIIVSPNSGFVKFDNKIFFGNALGELAYTTDGINQTTVTSAVTPLDLQVRNLGGTDYLVYRTNSPVSKHIFTLQAGSSTPVQRTSVSHSGGIPYFYPIPNTSKIAYTGSGEFWMLDITANTEVEVVDLSSFGSSQPQDYILVGDNLYFIADNGLTKPVFNAADFNLYSYNLVTELITRIETTGVSVFNNGPGALTKVGDYLFFSSRIDDNVFDRKLVKVDGITTEIIDPTRSNPEGLYTVDSDLYYTIPTNAGGYAIKQYNVETETNTFLNSIVLTQKTFAVYIFDDVVYLRQVPTNLVNALYRFDPHCSVPSNIIYSRNVNYVRFDWNGVNPYSSQGYDTALVLQGNDPNTQAIQPGSTSSTVTIRSFGISTLTEGVVYEFCIRSKCSATLSSEWNKLTFTAPVLCETVNNVSTSNLSSTSITINWDTSSYASNQTWYIVSEGQGNINTFIETGSVAVSGPQQSVIVNATSLIPNTNYDVYVVTTCQVASNTTSDLSDVHTFSIPIACDAPTNVSTSNITLSSLDLSWTASATAVDGYRWYVVPQGQGIGSPIEANNTSNTSVNVNASNLSPNTSYDVYVESICSTSPSVTELSLVHTFTTPISCEAPGTISITGLSASSNTFFLSWAVSTDAANGYAWYIVPTGSTDFISAIETGTTPNSSSTFVTVNATNLTPGAIYDAYVVSLCASSPNIDSGLSGLQTFTVPEPCSPPTSISTSNFTASNFTISWTGSSSANNGYNWYVVNSGAEGIASPVVSGSSSSGTSSIIVSSSNLTLNASYDVYVESICSVGATSDLSIAHTFSYQVLSINNFDLKKIKLYPNPVNSEIYIKGLTESTKVTIFDITGKQVFKMIDYLDTSIDIRAFKSGLYMVKLENKLGHIALKLIVN